MKNWQWRPYPTWTDITVVVIGIMAILIAILFALAESLPNTH